jgi:hypothetical protein
MAPVRRAVFAIRLDSGDSNSFPKYDRGYITRHAVGDLWLGLPCFGITIQVACFQLEG